MLSEIQSCSQFKKIQYTDLYEMLTRSANKACGNCIIKHINLSAGTVFSHGKYKMKAPILVRFYNQFNKIFVLSFWIRDCFLSLQSSFGNKVKPKGYGTIALQSNSFSPSNNFSGKYTLCISLLYINKKAHINSSSQKLENTSPNNQGISKTKLKQLNF